MRKTAMSKICLSKFYVDKEFIQEYYRIHGLHCLTQSVTKIKIIKKNANFCNFKILN